MSEAKRRGGLLLGGMALAGAAVGGSVLLRQFDAWALGLITRPERRAAVGTPRDHGLAYEEIRLRSADAVDLFGWLIPAPGGAAGHPTLILGHGFSDNSSSLLGFAAWLHGEGYNVLLLDFRGHGQSGGAWTTVGYLEHQDVGAGLAFLRERGLGQVGVMGWSLGGAVAVVSGALYPALAGVIADSTFARLASPLGRAAQMSLHHPAWLATLEGLYGERLVGRSFGFKPLDARPVSLVGRISPRPLLLIHSAEDQLIPVDNSRRLYAAAGEPKELWITPTGEHALGPWQTEPAEYRRRVLGFWARAFGAGR